MKTTRAEFQVFAFLSSGLGVLAEWPLCLFPVRDRSVAERTAARFIEQVRASMQDDPFDEGLPWTCHIGDGVFMSTEVRERVVW